MDTNESEDRVDFNIVVGGSTRGADVLVKGSSYVYIKDGKLNKNELHSICIPEWKQLYQRSSCTPIDCTLPAEK